MRKYKINFFHYSQNSILVNWPQSISPHISSEINSFCKAIYNDENIIEFRKGYCSLLIQFNSKNISYNRFRVYLINIYDNLKEIKLYFKSSNIGLEAISDICLLYTSDAADE